MKEEEVLSGLEKLVESLSIQLRYEKGDFAGGYCVLEDKRMMIVNSALSPAQRIKVLAGELAGMNLEEVFVLPALREAIMEGASSQGKAPASVAEGHPKNIRSEN
ncbi:hypothetical protein L0337_20905 [candidate division KSB1 bacterium]|nr:hypothetical protein [candidate division KSB1 bacterium]